MRTNPKKWVTSSISKYPDCADFSEVENLLHDFTDSMQTRMREEVKYALALLMENRLLLCHSIYGEQTITPEWRIIPRMLDSDNILRYASFIQEEGHISVRYWEREATSSFIEWLGLPRKKAFLFGGKYAIRSEVESIVLELQLTEAEMDRWLSHHPELKEGKIKLSHPIQILTVSEIRAGTKHYDNSGDFLQDYEAEKHGVPRYQREYERLRSEALPLLVQYYDEKTRVVRKEGDEEVVEVDKATPDFDILFADETIQIRASYLRELARKLINGEPIRLFHAGLPFKTSPFVLGSMSVYNQLRLTAPVQRIAEFYNAASFQDRALDVLLKYVGLGLLKDANCSSPIAYAFQSLASEITSELSLGGRLTKVEDNVLEYKSRDVLAGDNEEIVQALAQDLQTKLREADCKVYLIGVEDDGSIGPIHASRLKSDRVEALRRRLLELLSLQHLFLLPIVQGQDALLLLVAFRP